MTSAVLTFTIVIFASAVAPAVDAQNITMIQQQQQLQTLNFTTANNTITAAKPGLNATKIIEAINAKVRAFYNDNGNIDVPTTNSESAVITKIDNKNTVR